MAGHPALPSLSAGTLKHRSEGHPSEVPPHPKLAKAAGSGGGESSGRVQRGLDGTSAGAVAAGVQVGAGAEGGDSAFPGKTAGLGGGHQAPPPVPIRASRPNDMPWLEVAHYPSHWPDPGSEPRGTTRGGPDPRAPAIPSTLLLHCRPPRPRGRPVLTQSWHKLAPGPPPRQVLRGPQSRRLVLPEPGADQRAPLGG